MKNERYFEHYNPNPKGTNKARDCCVRALSKALDIDWYSAFDEISLAQRDVCSFDVLCYLPKIMKEFGFVKRTVPAAKKGDRSLNVSKFCEEHPEGTYLLRLAHHLVCVSDGKFWDTWDCSSCKVYTYWEKTGAEHG